MNIVLGQESNHGQWLQKSSVQRSIYIHDFCPDGHYRQQVHLLSLLMQPSRIELHRNGREWDNWELQEVDCWVLWVGSSVSPELKLLTCLLVIVSITDTEQHFVSACYHRVNSILVQNTKGCNKCSRFFRCLLGNWLSINTREQSGAFWPRRGQTLTAVNFLACHFLMFCGLEHSFQLGKMSLVAIEPWVWEEKKVKAIYMWHIEFDRFVIASGAKPAALISTPPHARTHTHTHWLSHKDTHAQCSFTRYTRIQQPPSAWKCEKTILALKKLFKKCCFHLRRK